MRNKSDRDDCVIVSDSDSDSQDYDCQYWQWCVGSDHHWLSPRLCHYPKLDKALYYVSNSPYRADSLLGNWRLRTIDRVDFPNNTKFSIV